MENWTFADHTSNKMLNLKVLVYFCLILALTRANPNVERVQAPAPRACPTFSSVDVTPTSRLNQDGGAVTNPTGLKVSVMGVCSPSDETFSVQIDVTIPVFDYAAPTPGTPEDPISESDDLEHVQIYFANENKVLKQRRIFEIRFNRFMQYKLSLLSSPYNELNSDLPKPVIEVDVDHIPPEDGDMWRGKVTFDAKLLPANFTKIAVFVINPLNNEGYEKYISTYRMYNHALSILDLQVVTNYKDVTNDAINIVPPEINNEYSSYWDGLEG